MNTVEQMPKLYVFVCFHLGYQFSFYCFDLSLCWLHEACFPLFSYIILNSNIFNLGVNF